MFLPIINYATATASRTAGGSARWTCSACGERLSVPLTWGGTRRAALEFDRTFKSGPLTRVESSIGIWQRENPHFDIDDQRVELKGRAERRFARLLRTRRAGITQLGRFRRHRRSAVDGRRRCARSTRRADPNFPRNAFLLGTGWTGLHVRSAPDRIDRYTTDARGYVGLSVRRSARRASSTRARRRTLPDYERLLLGGASTLRGFRDRDVRRRSHAGHVRGGAPADHVGAEQRAARRPRRSSTPARRGISASASRTRAGTRGVGGGVFLIAPIVKLNLDVAHGLTDGDTRVHLASGFAF